MSATLCLRACDGKERVGVDGGYSLSHPLTNACNYLMLVLSNVHST